MPRHRHVEAYALVVVQGALSQVSYAGRVELRAGEHEVSDITFGHPLATTGFLTVKTTPPSDVYNNDKLLGQTPLDEIAIKAGVYTLTFRNPQKGAVVRRVTITAGKTTKLSFAL